MHIGKASEDGAVLSELKWKKLCEILESRMDGVWVSGVDFLKNESDWVQMG